MKSCHLMMAAVALFALATLPRAAVAQGQAAGCIQNDYEQSIEVDLWGNQPRIKTWVAAKERKCIGPTDGFLITWVYIGSGGMDPTDTTNVRRYDGDTSFDLIRVWKKGTKVTPNGVFDDVGVCRDAEC